MGDIRFDRFTWLNGPGCDKALLKNTISATTTSGLRKKTTSLSALFRAQF